MVRFKYIYGKPKSKLREIIQNLFLKILLTVFPKKFLYHKNRIKNLINFINVRKFYWLHVNFLRFRYLSYFHLPSTQLNSIHMLIKFLKILKKEEISFFLTGGSLLGAVRQESFAGKPSDVDLGIREEQLPRLLKAIPLLIKNGAANIRRWPLNRTKRLQIFFPFTLIDVGIYKKKGKIWVGETENFYDKKFKGITFPIKDLENLSYVKAYGLKFLAPANPETYLRKKFGKNWKTPDKKQFFWNKKKIKYKF